MPEDRVICRWCRGTITKPEELAKDRRYRVKSTGRELKPQKRHDACDETYHKMTPGLERIG